MKTSYSLGAAIVGATIVGSAMLVAGGQALRGAAPPKTQAADLDFELGAFQLVERSGRKVRNNDLDGRVWVAAFIFTRCPLSCPRITSVMKDKLEPRLAGSSVQLVSLSVDPEYDRPEVLSRYADGYHADKQRWWFLTGAPDEVLKLIRERFKLGVEAAPPAEPGTPDNRFERITHSARLALVDGNRVVAYFDSNDAAALDELVARAHRLAAPSWTRSQPALNASLNATCAVLLVTGWTFIRTGRRRAHAACMITAVSVSALFLASYLVYHYYVGSVAFRGLGSTRLVYFTILLSHTLLATFGVVPLVTLTLLAAARRRFDRHAAIARVTFPIWLYVSVTGVVVYWMLYQLAARAILS